jgi:antitoxin (DNA-binding transcriptional repressor) of toxin-antitoxin stability system
MTKKISATEAVRKFSEMLSSIKYQGERYTILRGGKPVASIYPVAEPSTGKTLAELRKALPSIPKLAEEAAAFEADIRAARDSQPMPPDKR